MISFGIRSWFPCRSNLTCFKGWPQIIIPPHGFVKSLRLGLKGRENLNECFSLIIFLAASVGVVGFKLLISHLFDIFAVTVFLLPEYRGKRLRGEK